ncbi:DUF2938 domain-containing protein [Enterobacter kobei]|uniref:DUF2938 domain-containing protein n=1 Tax=Enterobacter kobei TaxID=208224 RepID=UPI003A9768B1
MERMWFLHVVLTGIGGTLVMDAWSLFQKHGLTIPPLNYGLVGRWLSGLSHGKVCHHTILTTPKRRGEMLTGWIFHYLTGIVFAVVPLWLDGERWLRDPSLTTALLAGVLTLFAPFLILQPALGFGIAASRTPHPWRARGLSLLTHLAYGVGLYVAAQGISRMG